MCRTCVRQIFRDSMRRLNSAWKRLCICGCCYIVFKWKGRCCTLDRTCTIRQIVILLNGFVTERAHKWPIGRIFEQDFAVVYFRIRLGIHTSLFRGHNSHWMIFISNRTNALLQVLGRIVIKWQLMYSNDVAFQVSLLVGCVRAIFALVFSSTAVDDHVFLEVVLAVASLESSAANRTIEDFGSCITSGRSFPR